MTNKLVSLAALLALGCGLDTAGQGPADDEDYTPTDTDITPDNLDTVLPDAVEADIGEPDVLDLAEVEPPPETADEGDENDAEGTADDATPETEADGEGTEDARDAEDEGGEEDGEATDPCAPPEIPAIGLYFFYCLNVDWTTDLTLERWVDRAGTGLPDDLWGVEPGCVTYDARSLFCEVHLAGPGTLIFNVHLLSMPWACDHLTTPYAHGTPRLWWNGVELTLGDPVWNGDPTSDGCNYTRILPTS